jgi:hypothetical protein
MSYDNDRYYILDCTGTVVGNQKGYRTMGSASSIANRHTGFTYDHLYHTYLKSLKTKLDQGSLHPMNFYKIVIGETLNKRTNDV